MPTKPRVEPDLTMQRACRLFAAVLHCIPEYGCRAPLFEAKLRDTVGGDFTAEEQRAAVNTMRDVGVISYINGVYYR